MSLNLEDLDKCVDFTSKNIEVLDNNNNLDDINIEIETTDNDKKNKDFNFLSDNDREFMDHLNSNSSTRPDSITRETDKKDKDEIMIKIDENSSYDYDSNNKTLQITETENKQVFKPGNSLNEPISETFRRDLNRIYQKIKHVLKLNKSEEDEKSMSDWDLWGPLLLCILLSR